MSYQSTLTQDLLTERIANAISDAMCKGEADTYEEVSSIVEDVLTDTKTEDSK